MATDVPLPPLEAAPVAAIVAPVEEGAPITTESHGFRYTIVGNTLLASDVLIGAVQRATTPREAIDGLNAEYQRVGFFLTALRGEVNGQDVALRVIHGRIAETDLVPSLAPFFSGIEDRADITRATVIRKSTLAEGFAGRQGMRPKINFAAGSTFGGSKMTVGEEPIEGAKSWNAGLGFGNLGSRFSSRYLASASAAFRPGDGVEFTANYAQGIPGLSPDTAGASYRNGGFGASIITPWGLYGMTYTGTTYRIGESAAPLYPEGDIMNIGITGTQLAFADESSRWVVTQSFTHNSNEVTVFDGAFTITDQHYDVLALGTSFNKTFALFGLNASSNVGVTLQKGTSPRTGTFVPQGDGVADPRFGLVQATFNYSQSLPAGFSASFALSGQWADATVPQNQQWVLGGFGNLTAYVPAVLVGDSGTLLRIGAYSPPWSAYGFTFTGSAFVEGGIVRSHFTPFLTPVTRGLSDAGLSVSGNTSFGTSLTLAYAWPLTSRNLDEKALDSLSKANLYFTLNQSF
ncbi:MAG: ShlB/FhaC/HecB family hemolysin secretion/activation protein [Betaproteobacteria bacterium]